MPIYEFRVTDADGLWGDLRIQKESEAEAQQACSTDLENYDDVNPPVTLTLLRASESCDEAAGKIPKKVGGNN